MKRQQHDGIDAFYRYTWELQKTLQEWLLEHDGREVPLHLRDENRCRLIQLRTWSLRYHLPVKQILSMVMRPLRKGAKTRGRIDYAIGVSFNALLGTAAERIIKEKIERRYPRDEHIALWRQRERRAQLRREAADAGESPQPLPGTIEEYVEQADGNRRLIQIAETEAWRKRKNYRNNPW
ncbi:MAG: hypothetical protein KGL39_25465 [Patescibacteria group bacterium]|nr:hypothetical protein [Patescibacteria group bacterium]